MWCNYLLYFWWIDLFDAEKLWNDAYSTSTSLSIDLEEKHTHTGKMSGCSTTPINDLFLEDNKKPKTHISASDTLYSSTTILGLSTFELLFVLTMSYAKVQKISHICTCENGCNIHLDGLHCYCSKYREIYYSIFLHLLLLL